MSKQVLELVDKINAERVGWRDDGGRLGVFFNGTEMNMIVEALRCSAVSAPACVHKSCDDPEWCVGEPVCRYTEPQSSKADDEIDYDNPRFNQGVEHVVSMLARTLDANGWVHGDGSEDYDCDLEQTLINILEAAGLYDADTGEFGHGRCQADSSPQTAPAREEVAKKLMEFADLRAWELTDREMAEYLRRADAILALRGVPAQSQAESATKHSAPAASAPAQRPRE